MRSNRQRFETLWGPHARAAADEIAQYAFQSEAWVEAVSAARGRRHRFVVVRVVDGDYAGACLFGGVHRRCGIEVFESMPMGGYGGWCHPRSLDEGEEASLSRAWLARSRWWLVGLTVAPGRESSSPSPFAPAWLPPGWRDRLIGRPLSTHILSLAGDNTALLMRTRPKTRNHLRRVDRSGYGFDVNGPSAEADFCRLFRVGSAEWKQAAHELMPDEFFRRLYAGGLADIWQVKKDGRCIAAAMFLKGRTEVFYQASGTIRERNEVSAIDALLWTAIRHYRDGGYRTLNLGASEGLDSVRFFKEKFGAVATPYRHVTFVLPKLLVSTAGGTASCR